MRSPSYDEIARITMIGFLRAELAHRLNLGTEAMRRLSPPYVEALSKLEIEELAVRVTEIGDEIELLCSSVDAVVALALDPATGEGTG